ncbi:MAG: D-glycero-beta-D-manno-heptose 1,7-bisphosphate 7-phosphatase [Gammaproteobacteria bacterium]|nr:D-glycero-beta-D-manno-heptose 1,7-bisphosphate 7-phosphatase [Gammaproteobacteria bacterium]
MKLVILDRDGVINHDSDNYIKSVDEWQPISGSLEAIARLNQAGYRVVVVTNQSGLARGYFTLDEFYAMNQKLHRLLRQVGGQLEGLFFCPHAPDEQCACRKPKPGLLHDVAKRLDVDLKGVAFVGDALGDLQAALAVGAKPILVLTGKGQRTQHNLSGLGDVPVYADLSAFVDHVLR